MFILNDAHAIAAYKCIRATALWFAGQLESEAVTRSGATVVARTTREETWATSLEYLEQLRDLAKVQSVRDAVVLCGTTGGAAATCAAGADSRAGIECLCPECTLREMLARRATVINEHAS